MKCGLFCTNFNDLILQNIWRGGKPFDFVNHGTRAGLNPVGVGLRYEDRIGLGHLLLHHHLCFPGRQQGAAKSILLITLYTIRPNQGCLDDSDCVPLGHKFACFFYKCLNWVDKYGDGGGVGSVDDGGDRGDGDGDGDGDSDASFIKAMIRSTRRLFSLKHI